jgi:DNA-binding transcriptional LysR family regulator
MADRDASPLDLADLRLFVAVAAAGSFSRAAILNGTTQSAISKRMLALEQVLDCRLFERSGRGAKLTEPGRLLLPHAESLTTQAAGLRDLLAEATGQPRGRVRFAIQQAVSWPLVAQVFARLAQAYPSIHLEVSEAPMTQIDEWLREGRVDLAVVSRLRKDAPPAADLLFDPTIHLISRAGDEATRAPSVPFARLAALPLILPSPSNAGRLMLEEQARRSGVALRVVLELNSIHLIKRLVATGAGYAIGALQSTAAEVEAGVLSATRIVRPVIRQRFYLSFAGHREPAAAVRIVADVVRAVARAQSTR